MAAHKQLTFAVQKLQLSDRALTAAIDIVICLSLVKLLMQNGIPTYYKCDFSVPLSLY